MLWISIKEELAAVALALGARHVAGWSEQEEVLARQAPLPPANVVEAARQAIQRGDDPLGEAFCRIVAPEIRRSSGAVYTPPDIVAAMLAWVEQRAAPTRIIDPGTGSARFLVAAGRMFRAAQLVGVENDPVAALLARGHIAAAGLAERAQIIVADYRALNLEPIEGPTLFVGNPPYVRHHLIDAQWKAWLVRVARVYGYEASKLAGLHAHFFLATAELARQGDLGVFITAAEWLDVNYGKLVRQLLLNQLGVCTLHIIEPTAFPFPKTATTAVITGFEVGTKPKAIALRRVGALEDLHVPASDWHVRRETLAAATRWTSLTRPSVERRQDFIELGELCRVHRGQVTGANKVWIAGPHSARLPQLVLFRSITKARELFAANENLGDASLLRQVIDLPVELDTLQHEERRAVEAFLEYARSQGADRGFIARNRKAWWSVGLRDPAPILATYMARRPPAFVRNTVGARHINIAHGLYPREALADDVLISLAKFLSHSIAMSSGRVYAGGLTKFEPREMERLLVPHPAVLAQGVAVEELIA